MLGNKPLNPHPVTLSPRPPVNHNKSIKCVTAYPSSEELPDSDETPVDNELQELLPSLLKATLLML